MERIPGNHKLRERILVPLVESGELVIDEQGQIWRTRMRMADGHGNVRYVDIHPPRRAEHDQGDYLMIRGTIGKQRIHALAHRLVWHVFYGPIPAGLCINHKDGNKKNNRPENLELATYSENSQHARHVLGRYRRQHGALNHRAKLVDDDIRAMRRMRDDGRSLNEIAAQFGVAFQTVSKIVRGDRWQHVT